MAITFVLLGIVAGFASVVAAIVAGLPVWVAAMAYPLGGLVAVSLLLGTMFLLMPPRAQGDDFAGAAKAG